MKNSISRTIVAITFSATTIVSIFPYSSLEAKPFLSYRGQRNSVVNANTVAQTLKLKPNQNRQNYNTPKPNGTNNNSNRPNSNYVATNLTLGTVIPTYFPSNEKILVTKEETMNLTLVVSEDVRDNTNKLVIPASSEIIGVITPSENGTRFVADKLILPNGSEYPISANSAIITRTENISEGKNTDAIWQGALAGAAASTVIAGITGDKAIATEEILGGAGFGALAGFIFGGDRTQELISIDTENDLDLVLTADFAI